MRIPNGTQELGFWSTLRDDLLRYKSVFLNPIGYKAFLLAALLLSGDVIAEEDNDLDALTLANQAPSAKEASSNWRIFAEGALGGSVLAGDHSYQPNQRASLDVQYDNTFAPGWRAVFADRFDASWPAMFVGISQASSNASNTIKEAYLSWQAQPDLLFDLGRINARNGVALGYNPTDYFKVNAVRSFVSVDPNSLKQNRQGSVMFRAQKLFEDSSVSLLYSPRLADNLNNTAFNPDVGATNDQHRWLLSYTKKIAEGFSPQVLVFKSDQLPTQFGLNVTSLLNDATVVFAEWSGGRSASPLAGETTFRNRLSAGLTYTTTNKISLTAEWEYNGAALTGNSWTALQQGSLLNYVMYRAQQLQAQDSVTRSGAFLFGTWQDALINHLDVSAMARIDLIDSSRLTWLEARYHLTKAEFALQWQRYSGSALSDFGASPQIQTWALVARYYF